MIREKNAEMGTLPYLNPHYLVSLMMCFPEEHLLSESDDLGEECRDGHTALS